MSRWEKIENGKYWTIFKHVNGKNFRVEINKSVNGIWNIFIDSERWEGNYPYRRSTWRWVESGKTKKEAIKNFEEKTKNFKR